MVDSVGLVAAVGVNDVVGDDVSVGAIDDHGVVVDEDDETLAGVCAADARASPQLKNLGGAIGATYIASSFQIAIHESAMCMGRIHTIGGFLHT